MFTLVIEKKIYIYMLFFIGLQIHWIAMLVSQRFDACLAPQSSVHELAVSPWSLEAQTPFQTY